MNNIQILKLGFLSILFFLLIGLMGCTPATHSPSSPMTSNLINLTFTPSVTAHTTLTASEAQIELSQLLASNPCEFPCLWGITPGITGLSEVESLNRFSILSDGGGVFSKTGGRLFLRVPQPNDTLLNLSLDVDMIDGVIDQMFFGTQLVRKNESGYEWVTDDPLYSQVTKGFSLSPVLLEYGEPSQVYIFTMKAVPMSDPWNFDILLLYPEKHFVVRYTAFVEYVQDGDIVACPSWAFSSFWFWKPSKAVSTQEMIARYHFEEGKPIDVATTMSGKTFYSTFKEADKQQCIKTPQEIWPLP